AKLQDEGATLNGDRVLLPPELVEKSIEISTKNVKTRGRDGKIITLGDGSLHWHNLGGAMDIYDHGTGKVRRSTLQDLCNATRLLDALDQATTITPFFTPIDVPGELMSLAMYRYALPHTTKPLQGPGVQTAREVKIAVDMAEVIGPVGEVLTMSVSPVSPLTFPAELVESMVEIARYGIPFGPLPCPTAGTTAPMSLAGALTQQNAEVLASIVIVQMVKPGLPIVYCGRLAMMEPRTGISVWGGVEMGMASAATVQLGHRYGLPVNVYGLSTNSHSLEIQNGYERALNAILPALAGADELSGIGEMAAGITGSLAQIVVDNDIATSVRRVLRGFQVNSDSLAVDVIKDAMDGQRNFITQRHTIKYLRGGELFHNTLGVRRSFEDWERSGRVGLAENAQAEAERILAEHEVPPLEDSQEKELDNIMNAAERELVK
ncbi:MAG: trimethylamine methyltransferase family protein, partial [Chloroflexi bacterium]|nr:trimethylamine methyltransferase family protein [Chloroflexota bacterium]